MKKLFFLIYILFTSVVVSQKDNKALFDAANENYKLGNFQKAIDQYLKIEESKQVSSDLYYNIANSYYKLNNVANTIYYYEKALILNPLNEDASNNLEFAKRMTIDNIEELPKTFLQKIEVNYIKKLSYNQWAILAVIFSFIGAILFLLFYYSTISSKKRIYFLTSVLSFVFLSISVFTSFNQYQKEINTKYAILYASKASVNNAPTSNADEVFILHEGTKINIIDTVDNWKKIKLADGKIGWISADSLKEL